MVSSTSAIYPVNDPKPRQVNHRGLLFGEVGFGRRSFHVISANASIPTTMES